MKRRQKGETLKNRYILDQVFSIIPVLEKRWDYFQNKPIICIVF